MLEFRTMGYMTVPDHLVSLKEDEDALSEELIDYNGYNKETCEELKRIRKQIAYENDLDVEIKECKSDTACNRPCRECIAEADEIDRLMREKR